MDLLLDENNDLYLDGNGNTKLTVLEEELVRQRLWITLSMFKGEWFANTSFGIPYLDRDGSGEGLSILGGKNMTLLDFELQSAIRRTKGVEDIVSYSSSFDRRTRRVTVDFAAITESGVIVSVQQIM